MPELRERGPRHELVELQAWYLHSLRPKVVHAAGAGTVASAAVEALDRHVRELLDLLQTRQPARQSPASPWQPSPPARRSGAARAQI